MSADETIPEAEDVTVSEAEVVRSNGPSFHGPECLCVRCVGFQPGNALGVRHGAYSRVRLAPRATELVDWLREVAPLATPADEIVIGGLALAFSRLEAASRGLEALDGDHPLAQYVGRLGGPVGDRLRADTARWLRLVLAFAESLALTPATRARLAIETTEAQRAQVESALNLSRLDDDELVQLRELLGKAEDA